MNQLYLPVGHIIMLELGLGKGNKLSIKCIISDYDPSDEYLQLTTIDDKGMKKFFKLMKDAKGPKRLTLKVIQGLTSIDLKWRCIQPLVLTFQRGSNPIEDPSMEQFIEAMSKLSHLETKNQEKGVKPSLGTISLQLE